MDNTQNNESNLGLGTTLAQTPNSVPKSPVSSPLPETGLPTPVQPTVPTSTYPVTPSPKGVNVLVLFLIILLMAAIAAGAYYYGSQQSNRVNQVDLNSLQPTAITVTTTPSLAITATPITITPTASPSMAVIDDKALSDAVYQNYVTGNSKYNQENPSSTLPIAARSDTTISISKLQGNYAVGSFGLNNGGGSVWMAKKANGQWSVVWEGQDGPSCDELPSDFPTELSECY